MDTYHDLLGERPAPEMLALAGSGRDLAQHAIWAREAADRMTAWSAAALRAADGRAPLPFASAVYALHQAIEEWGALLLPGCIPARRWLKELLAEEGEYLNAPYPQYRNHWSGPEWRPMVATRAVSTKAGLVMVTGELVLAREARAVLYSGVPGRFVLSRRTGIDTWVQWGDVAPVPAVLQLGD